MVKMNKGKVFENNFKDSFNKTPFFIMRLRDSAKWTQEGASFTPSQPCDSIVFIMPFLFPLELKSTEGASVSFYPNTPWERPETTSEKMIKPHQVKSLMEFAEKQGVLSGFIINFRPRQLKTKETKNKVYFIHINDFITFVKATDKGSINQEDCEAIGVEIFGRQKKVNYEYDIADFIDRAIPYYINKGYIDVTHLKALREWLNKWVDQLHLK